MVLETKDPGHCATNAFQNVNSLSNNKFLDWSKLKALADNKINVTEKLKFVLGRVENILGKGENAGYQHLLLFPIMFSKGLYFRVVKSRSFFP